MYLILVNSSIGWLRIHLFISLISRREYGDDILAALATGRGAEKWGHLHP